MKTKVKTALIGFLCLVSMPARADDAADDKMRLQGVWVLSSGETNGKPLGEVLRKKGLDGLKVKFSGNVMTMTGFGAPDYSYQFTLIPTDRPKVIRLVTVETHGKASAGSILNGIYEIKDEKLKLCLPGDSTVKQPMEFAAPKGSRLSSLVLVRQVDADKPHVSP